MTYEKLITSINYKIENSTFEKFKIDHIVDEINQVLRALAVKTNAFETLDYMLLFPEQTSYSLPNKIFKPSRAVYKGHHLDFISQENMDMRVPGWEAHTAARDLEYLVYNNLSKGLVMPYPRLLDTEVQPDVSDLTLLGQLSDVTDSIYTYLYVSARDGAKYLAEKPLGTVSDLGLVEVVSIYGAYLPKEVLAIAVAGNLGLLAEVELDEEYVNALIMGVAGNLLLTSGRTEDMAKGERYLKIFGLDETDIGALRERQFSGSTRDTNRGTRYYRTPFQQ